MARVVLYDDPEWMNTQNTLVDLALSVEGAAGTAPVFDSVAGEYTNISLAAFMASRRNGLMYGVSIPKGPQVVCTKTLANAGMANPTPSTLLARGVDPYVGVGPFFFLEVNGYVTPDGEPHVTAIQGDGRFTRTPAVGIDVWIMAPVLWWKMTEDENTVELSVSDTPMTGFKAQPKAMMPNEKFRPYMLYAKYPLSIESGAARSVSGASPQVRNVSHNTLITQCKNASSGYSGKSYGDDWYMKVMFLLKYATKNSQSVYGGTSSFSLQYRPAAADTGTSRVVLTTAQANNFPVGCSVLIGTGSDRAAAASYNVADTTVLSVEDLGGGLSALNLDLASPINVTTDLYVSSWHWRTGACDGVEGDGAPLDPTATNQPYVVQGMEWMHGFYEIMGDLILSNTGAGWTPMMLKDSKYAATSVTANYTDPGLKIETTDSAWKYPYYPVAAGDGLLFGAGGYGASSTTGMSDGTYINPVATVGTREWLSLGGLGRGAYAGAWCVRGTHALSNPHWSYGSRLSAIGRSSMA